MYRDCGGYGGINCLCTGTVGGMGGINCLCTGTVGVWGVSTACVQVDIRTALPDMVAILLNFENTPDTVSLGGANIVR